MVVSQFFDRCLHLKKVITSKNPYETDCFIQAPLRSDLMQTGVKLAHEAGIAVIWCPGQFADQLTAQDIRATLEHTRVVVGNSHEISYLKQLASLEDQIVIETHGADPVQFTAQGQRGHVSVPFIEAVDPTGCGDAFASSS